MASPEIIEQENEILRRVIDNPGVWNLSKLSRTMGVPTSTLKYRVRHLRASGYFLPFSTQLTTTDDGRVAYFRRTLL